MNKWHYFTEDEMRCKCGCGKCEMDEDFMEHLEAAREYGGHPFVITSGYRCEKHDKEVGGAGNHSAGKAVDIAFKDGKEAYGLLQDLNDAEVGFKRIGISFKGKFIHVDDVPDRPTPCLWTY